MRQSACTSVYWWLSTSCTSNICWWLSESCSRKFGTKEVLAAHRLVGYILNGHINFASTVGLVIFGITKNWKWNVMMERRKGKILSYFGQIWRSLRRIALIGAFLIAPAIQFWPIGLEQWTIMSTTSGRITASLKACIWIQLTNRTLRLLPPFDNVILFVNTGERWTLGWCQTFGTLSKIWGRKFIIKWVFLLTFEVLPLVEVDYSSIVAH